MANIKFTVVADATRAAGTPADGDYVWTSDTKKLYRGDGATAGGVLIGPPANLTAAQTRALVEAAPPSVVTITGDTTLTAATHQGKLLYCTTGALNITVDTNTDFDAYASCEIVNKTGAVVTFVATATINRIGSKPLTLPANGRATLMREATADVYLLTGEMA